MNAFMERVGPSPPFEVQSLCKDLGWNRERAHGKLPYLSSATVNFRKKFISETGPFSTDFQHPKAKECDQDLAKETIGEQYFAKTPQTTAEGLLSLPDDREE